MNLNRVDGITLSKNILESLSFDNKVEVIIATSFINLYEVATLCSCQDNVFVASQNCSDKERGAFTGEVSAEMVSSCGAQYVILGHSERRINFSETNELLRCKVQQALSKSLQVIFCCGESLKQRQAGTHFEWIQSQIFESLFHLSAEEFANVIIAYEPIWAIGTGVTATSNQAQEVHRFIRKIIEERYDSIVSQKTPILYGGSCNPINANELFSQHDIDGGLIGGASLDADDFVAITNSF